MYKKMMVPLDGSELAECVLPHVEAFITGFRIAEIVFVRVLEPMTISTSAGPHMLDDLKERESAREASAREYLNQVVERIKHDGTKMQTVILNGRVAERLSDYSGKNDIDIILIATHGRSGVTRWVRGSVADKILRSANLPVLMVRAPGTKGGI